MYFETGQGSALSAEAHHGVDQLTLEARAYGVARAFDPFLVNSVVGFIGPEYLYDERQIIRAGLEDHFMGKLLGLPMGCDVCYTNHAAADQNSADNLLLLLAAAGCNYFMGVPCADDVMLNYQSTSYPRRRWRCGGSSACARPRSSRPGWKRAALATGRPTLLEDDAARRRCCGSSSRSWNAARGSPDATRPSRRRRSTIADDVGGCTRWAMRRSWPGGWAGSRTSPSRCRSSASWPAASPRSTSGFCSVGGASIGLGWPLVCLFALVVAATMGQLASAFPTAGGLYHWASILGGRGWGWATAWFNLAGLVTVLAAINVGTYRFAVGALRPRPDARAWTTDLAPGGRRRR